jgi:hypothetical protein
LVLAKDRKQINQQNVNVDYKLKEKDKNYNKHLEGNNILYKEKNETSVKYKVEDLVEITSNFQKAKRLQNGHGGWVNNKYHLLVNN